MDHLALRVSMVLQQRLGVLPAGKSTNLLFADVSTEVNRDDIVEVRTRSLAKNSALLYIISRLVGQRINVCLPYA
jgi:hypothetical protein